MYHRILLPEQPAIDLIEPIRTLGADVTELDLAENRLGFKSTAEIIQVLAAIPERVISLNLSCNSFCEKSIDEIIQILAAIPKTVSHLDLGGNFYREPEKGNQERIFAAIPLTVNSLALVCHNFAKDGPDLAHAFTAFGKKLLILDLYATGLDQLSLESLKQLKSSLPYVQTVYLHYDEIVRMGREKASALQDIFPNVKEMIILNDEAERIEMPTLLERTNFFKKLGFKVDVPSLVNQCTFFIKKDVNNYDTPSLPVELQETVNNFFVPQKAG